MLRGRSRELTRSGATTGDARWLELCVTAAELHRGLRAIAALHAAIHELSAAYPDSYPRQDLLVRAAFFGSG